METRIYIKSKIKQVGLSIGEVSELMGYSSPAGLSNMLRQPKKFNAIQIGELAKIIKLRPSSLFNRIYNN